MQRYSWRFALGMCEVKVPAVMPAILLRVHRGCLQCRHVTADTSAIDPECCLQFETISKSLPEVRQMLWKQWSSLVILHCTLCFVFSDISEECTASIFSITPCSVIGQTLSKMLHNGHIYIYFFFHFITCNWTNVLNISYTHPIYFFPPSFQHPSE